MQEDTNAGLIGPSIIYARGQMEQVMATHREFPILYMSFDEHVSFMSKINNMTANDTSSGSNMTFGIDSSASQHDSSCSSSSIYSGSCNASVYPSSNDGGSSQGIQGRTGGSQEFSDLINADASYGNRSIWGPQLTNLLSSAWGSGATFYSLNGYVLANNPIFEACKNDNVIWYTYAYGSGSHVFHMHGNGFTENGHLMPSISKLRHSCRSCSVLTDDVKPCRHQRRQSSYPCHDCVGYRSVGSNMSRQ
jgi:FtsP/CotA-like multicopper oxidase with cupredoxin domain